MGAVGVFAAKARFANASGTSASSAAKPIPISKVGAGANCQIVVPPVVQRGRGTAKTLWHNKTGEDVTITFVIVPEGSDTPEPIEMKPDERRGGRNTTLDEGWYKYSVAVDRCGVLDPWLDIQ